MSEYSSLLPRQGNSHVQHAAMRNTRQDSDEDSHNHGHNHGHSHGHSHDHDHEDDGCGCCSSFLNLCRPVRSKSTKVPLRVEPKTFFANERTFLSWLNMSLTISILALGLVGFADDLGMQIAGIILLSTGVLFSLYAYFVFVRRAQKIRAREDGPYDDVIGPGVLLFVINAAIVASLLAAVIFGDQEQA
eukprot:TRINITY_DN2863_c0_g1_i2.p1 TRINITY_DN2863_c0_g1~~TRINITY_DN2863_c0_g1_i2.p1  ORF type:complete len:189 (+),score=42.82 TRINITY_DN2863_c0_g1_i2:67-633(+)